MPQVSLGLHSRLFSFQSQTKKPLKRFLILQSDLLNPFSNIPQHSGYSVMAHSSLYFNLTSLVRSAESMIVFVFFMLSTPQGSKNYDRQCHN